MTLPGLVSDREFKFEPLSSEEKIELNDIETILGNILGCSPMFTLHLQKARNLKELQQLANRCLELRARREYVNDK